MKIFFSLILFMFAIPAVNIKAASDTILVKSNFGLKGDVVSFKEKNYSAKNIEGRLENKRFISSYEYKIIGDLVLKTVVKQDAIITNFFYNEKNQLIEVSDMSLKDGSFEGKKLYFYDANNKPILELQYNSIGVLRDSIVITTNDDMTEITEIAYNPKTNKFLNKIDKRYNKFNKIDKKVRTTNESSTRFLYKYDSLGNLLVEKWFLNNELSQKNEFLYDSKGNMIIRKEYDEKENLFNTIEYSYDPISGLELEIRDNLHTIKFEYNFDNYGNWIVRYEFYDGTPTNITEREIEYKQIKK